MPAPLGPLRAAPPLPPARGGPGGELPSPRSTLRAPFPRSGRGHSRRHPARCRAGGSPGRPYLLRFLGAGVEAGAGALRQQAEAGGRAGETLPAQLPHGVPRRRLAGSKAGDVQPRPGRGSPRRAERPVPQQLGGPLTLSRFCRAANSPSRTAAILALSAEAGVELPLSRCRHLGAVS